MQRYDVISSDSAEVSEEDNEVTIMNLNHKEPMERVFALGKINRVLSNYANKDLDKFDKRLLKGFYINDINELENSDDKESREFNALIDNDN